MVKYDSLKVNTLDFDQIKTVQNPKNTCNDKIVNFILKNPKEKEETETAIDPYTMPSLFNNNQSISEIRVKQKRKRFNQERQSLKPNKI